MILWNNCGTSHLFLPFAIQKNRLSFGNVLQHFTSCLVFFFPIGLIRNGASELIVSVFNNPSTVLDFRPIMPEGLVVLQGNVNVMSLKPLNPWHAVAAPLVHHGMSLVCVMKRFVRDNDLLQQKKHHRST